MKKAGELMGSYDDEGRFVIGRGAKGCYYCGSVTIQPNEDGSVIVHRASVDCCAPALQRQLEARNAEIAKEKKRVSDDREKMLQLRRMIDLSPYSRDQEIMGIKLARAEEAQDRLLAEVHGNIKRLQEERSEVTHKLRALGQTPEAQTPPPPPGTYTLEELLNPPEDE